MELEEIISLLDQNTIVIEKNALAHHRYNGSFLLDEKLSMTLDDHGVAFFAPASTFNALPESAISGNTFFLFMDEPVKPLPARTSIILMADRDAWLSAFELVAREFRILQHKKEQIFGLTSLVSANTSLKRLVNEAASIIEAPASVLDNSMSFVAFSDDLPLYVAGGEESVSGVLPDGAISVMRARGFVNPSKPIDLVVFDVEDAQGETLTNHLSFIHAGNSVMGSLSFFTRGEHLRKSRAEMIPTIAQIISLELQKSSSYLLNKSMYYTYLFKQLQEGRLPQDPQRLQQQFSLFGYKLRRFLHMFVVDFRDELLPRERVQPLAERLHPFIFNSIYIVNENNLVFLSSSDEIHEDGWCDHGAIRQALAETAINVGVSSVFLQPARVPSYIQEAHRAIEVGRKLEPANRIFPFSRYRLLDMVGNVMDAKMLYSYRYPPLMHVIDLDEHNGTNLAYTLYVYLQDPAHPAEVARRLFVHKNTLYYRLDKIREIMGMDFRNAEVIANIQMTFHVLRMQDRFERLVLRGKEDVSWM